MSQSLLVAFMMSGPPKAGEEGGRGPMTFWDVAVFQWVNVMGWVMVIGTIMALPRSPAFFSTSRSL